MKVFVIIDYMRDLETISSVRVLKNKPDWELDFYEQMYEIELEENQPIAIYFTKEADGS